jgi:hypothetical protein
MNVPIGINRGTRVVDPRRRFAFTRMRPVEAATARGNVRQLAGVELAEIEKAEPPGHETPLELGYAVGSSGGGASAATVRQLVKPVRAASSRCPATPHTAAVATYTIRANVRNVPAMVRTNE